MFDIFILFTAGFVGGIINAIAGGGSFITFPALLFAGVPPVIANATNTYASCPGYLSGAYAFRKDLQGYRFQIWQAVILGTLGGALGAWLLLQVPEAAFEQAVPWLLLLAFLMFVFGPPLNKYLQKWQQHHETDQIPGFWRKIGPKIGTFALICLYGGICVYGGFFNAGLGIIVLAYLALAGFQHIHAMNGLKLITSSTVSVTAILIFILQDTIAWYEGSLVLAGTVVGGYIAADISRKLPQKLIRAGVMVASFGITAYFFYKIYFGSA